MKLNLDKSTKDLLVNLAFCVVVAVCCVVAYDRFFAPSVPKIYVIDTQKMQDEIRRETLALSYKQDGIPADEEYVIARVNELSSIIENVAKENKAFVFHKENVVVDDFFVKDITAQIIEIYKKQRTTK